MEHALEDLEVVIDIPNQPKDYIGNGYEIPENLQVKKFPITPTKIKLIKFKKKVSIIDQQQIEKNRKFGKMHMLTKFMFTPKYN